jgi:uncharacterized phage-associated protein
MYKFNPYKAINLLAFFAAQFAGKIDKMKVFKLIWLSDRLQMRTTGNAIINDTYYAMEFGPVPSKTFDLTKQTEKNLLIQTAFDQILDVSDGKFLIAKREPNLGFFSETDRNTIKFIMQHFGHLSGIQLSELSHIYPEWKKFETELALKKSRFLMDYSDFFKNPEKDNHAIFNEKEELLSLCHDVFLENQILANLA